jgi:hypothetical protein
LRTPKQAASQVPRDQLELAHRNAAGGATGTTLIEFVEFELK